MTDIRIGLALSGGGCRAALYHLGVLSYLHRAGLLSKVKYLCGVSGGSLVAAHVAHNWEAASSGGCEEFTDSLKPLIEMCQSDIRGRILRRTLFLRGQRVKYFERILNEFFGGKRLSEVPADAPDVALLATNMTDGQLIYFTQDGYSIRGHEELFLKTDSISTARAVAASAAFPMFFSPIKVTAKSLGDAAGNIGVPVHYLSDGGITDNVGYTYIKDLFDESKNRLCDFQRCKWCI